MKFKNDKQARAFLEGYHDWTIQITDDFYDRRTFVSELFGALIVINEVLHLSRYYDGEYNYDKEPKETWGLPSIYILPEGKKLKPMYEYRVKMTEAVKLIRQIDKERNDGTH